MKLVALVGFIGSGKDTVGRHLVETHGFYDMAFADALKDAVAAMFCWDRVMLDGKNPQSRDWRNQVDQWWARKLGIPGFTPRWALQNIGTETLRQYFRDDLWILNVERRIMNLREEHGEGVRIVLTDGRFPNELKMVHNLGGKVARVRRGPDPEWYGQAQLFNNPALRSIDVIPAPLRAIHESEWAWIGYPMDQTIANDAFLDTLFAQADNLAR